MNDPGPTMNAAEQWRRAEDALASANGDREAYWMGKAQVHATLALTAATVALHPRPVGMSGPPTIVPSAMPPRRVSGTAAGTAS